MRFLTFCTYSLVCAVLLLPQHEKLRGAAQCTQSWCEAIWYTTQRGWNSTLWCTFRSQRAAQSFRWAQEKSFTISGVDRCFGTELITFITFWQWWLMCSSLLRCSCKSREYFHVTAVLIKSWLPPTFNIHAHYLFCSVSCCHPDAKANLFELDELSRGHWSSCILTLGQKSVLALFQGLPVLYCKMQSGLLKLPLFLLSG